LALSFSGAFVGAVVAVDRTWATRSVVIGSAILGASAFALLILVSLLFGSAPWAERLFAGFALLGVSVGFGGGASLVLASEGPPLAYVILLVGCAAFLWVLA